MSKTQQAIHEIDKLNSLALRNQWVNKIHPLVKFVVTVIYIAITISFHKYDVMGVLGMMIYPLALFILADLSFAECVKRIWPILPFIVLLGVFNPIFDKNLVVLGEIRISAGFLSMLTLMLKCALSVFASYILVATTTISRLCYALRLIRVPKELVNQFMLSYRYVTLFLAEVSKAMDAYRLRAPGQRGIHISAWGSLVGRMLLRSISRADEIYESMLLRGYNGEFYIDYEIKNVYGSIIYFIVWLFLIVVFRLFPVLVIVGSIF